VNDTWRIHNARIVPRCSAQDPDRPRNPEEWLMSQREPSVTVEPTLDAYRFYEAEWGEYDELVEAFEWEIPEQFNAATYVCDRWAESEPDRVALVAIGSEGSDIEYTFEQLQAHANRLANYLTDQGVERGDRIAVSGAQRIECLTTLVAAWKLGAIAVPLSIRFGPDALGYRLTDSGASAIVADRTSLPALREVADDCEALETVLTVGASETQGDEVQFETAIDGQASTFDTATTDAEAPATIIYTSGTTGPPKGAVHPHRSLLGVLPSHVMQARNMAVRADDLIYSPAEWSWIGPLYQGVLASLYYGTPVLADADPQFDPERTFDLINRYGITFIGGATTVYRMMMQVPDPAERYDLSSLRVVLGAGESFGQTVVDWWHDLIDDVATCEAYGQTESGIVAGDCEALGVEHRPGHMGKPLPGIEMQVVDPETGEPVERDTVGELAVRYEGNPCCFIEYWNEPAKTARKVQNGWLRTEDMGSQTRDGYLSFHSRTDDVIISSGYRIGPAEIEESLATHEAVANAGVIGVPDDTRGEVPKAFVVLAEGHEPAAPLENELQAHVKDRLAKHEYPRAVAFVEDLPKTTTGKIRRHDLRKREGLVER